MKRSNLTTIYEDAKVRVFSDPDDADLHEPIGEEKFRFVWGGEGRFQTNLGPVTWKDLVEMVHFAVYPLGGERTTTPADIAGLPRYLAQKAIPEGPVSA